MVRWDLREGDAAVRADTGITADGCGARWTRRATTSGWALLAGAGRLERWQGTGAWTPRGHRIVSGIGERTVRRYECGAALRAKGVVRANERRTTSASNCVARLTGSKVEVWYFWSQPNRMGCRCGVGCGLIVAALQNIGLRRGHWDSGPHGRRRARDTL